MLVRPRALLWSLGSSLEAIMEAFPVALFVYNEIYDQTNTSKSLLKALRKSSDGGVLWMNGDVVFDPEVLARILPLIDVGQSFVCVNTAAVGEEEIKYTLGADGFINQLSKTVSNGVGEAVGINYVSAQDKQMLIARLVEVNDQDYFERGMELAVERDGIRFVPVDISDLFAVEVDFAEDLVRANERLPDL
jgi:choline kinase